jgi:hypothetical protein
MEWIQAIFAPQKEMKAYIFDQDESAHGSFFAALWQSV